MRSKILIIENDINTINAISQLVVILNYEPLVLYNWNSHLNLVSNDEVAAILVDVELPSVKVKSLVKDFTKDGQVIIPIYYLFSRSFSPLYRAAKNYHFEGELKKPVKLEEVYDLLARSLTFEQRPQGELELNINLDEYKKFANDFRPWAEKLNEAIS